MKKLNVAAAALFFAICSVESAQAVVLGWASGGDGTIRNTVNSGATWAGQISDSLCGPKHEEAAEGQGKMPDRDCTIACVRGGSKYVLVADGKVFQIANQDNKDLATHAGHMVKMTGEMKNNAITVAKIEMP